jgi:AcrR family transcriptional regulator
MAIRLHPTVHSSSRRNYLGFAIGWRAEAGRQPVHQAIEEAVLATLAKVGRTVQSGRGRPRDASRDDALRQAALEVMAEVGYRALTMDAVAARARAGKATIYRRWDSKLDLVIDTCNHLASGNIPSPNTGAVRTDLVEFTEQFVVFLTGPVGKAAQALVGELPHEPELAAAFRSTFLVAQQDMLRDVLVRGRARGEIGTETPLTLIMEITAGVLMYRLMLAGDEPDDSFATRLVEQALLPLLKNTEMSQAS